MIPSLTRNGCYAAPGSILSAYASILADNSPHPHLLRGLRLGGRRRRNEPCHRSRGRRAEGNPPGHYWDKGGEPRPRHHHQDQLRQGKRWRFRHPSQTKRSGTQRPIARHKHSPSRWRHKPFAYICGCRAVQGAPGDLGCLAEPRPRSDSLTLCEPR